MPCCFVLGLFDTGLAVVRALARTGIQVRAFDDQENRAGFSSRYGRPEPCPDPAYEPDAFVAFLLARAEEYPEPPLLFPTSDAFVSVVSNHRNALAGRLRHALPSPQAVANAMNKGEQYATAMAVGVPIPETHRPASLDDLVELSRRLLYPVIVKPEVGHVWRREYRREKAIQVEDRDALVTLYREIFSSGHRALVQSLILGPNTNHCKVCAYIGAGGSPLALMCMRKIRQYPTDFGIGTMMESVEEPEVAELGLRFFAAMQWRGPGSIEFKRDDRDGRWKLIELNPRLWQQNGLAADCGMNFPLIQYLDLTGQPRTADRYEVGRRWVDEFRDPSSAWIHHRAGHLTFADWLRSYRGVRSFALLAADDPCPFLASAARHANVAFHRALGLLMPAHAVPASSAAQQH